MFCTVVWRVCVIDVAVVLGGFSVFAINVIVAELAVFYSVVRLLLCLVACLWACPFAWFYLIAVYLILICALLVVLFVGAFVGV